MVPDGGAALTLPIRNHVTLCLLIEVHLNASQSVAILVEVKGFENMPSPVDYLAEAVGKYVLYRSTLDYVGITEPLYLAVPHAAYMGILSEVIGQCRLQPASHFESRH